MAGTRAGGLKSAAKILVKKPNHFKEIGAKGGHNGNTGGFASNPELAQIAGAKGGARSRRGYIFVRETPTFMEYTDKMSGEKVKFYK